MADKESVITVDHLYKSFKLPHEQHSGIKQYLVNIFKGKRGYETQEVLNDISFDIKKGEFFGIVGRNGSGKSTLLKILAGTYVPDKGSVFTKGSLTPFIELGVGFNPELTGRENIYMNGALLGFGHSEVDEMYDGIVKFAELEKFMDQKLKNYSSGMQVRLAFSIAIRARSDLLLIDEVLAVGDAAFQSKCFDYFLELKKSDTTVIFISHDKASLERFCTNGILIDQGRIIESGDIKKVLDKYTPIVLSQMDGSGDDDANKSPKSSKTEKVSLQSISISQSGKKIKNATFGGEPINVKCRVKFNEPASDPIIGITLWLSELEQFAVYATNNLIEKLGEFGEVPAGKEVEFSINLPTYINDGEYSIEVGVANDSATSFFLQKKRAIEFRVFGSNNPHAILANEGDMKIE